MYGQVKSLSVAVSVFTACFSFSSALAQVSVAAPCDPDKILRDNISQYNENIAIWLAYVKNIDESMSSDDKKSLGVSYDGINLNYADAATFSRYIHDHENYSFTKSQSIATLRSTLSADSVRAYIACLHSNDPVTVLIPDTAMSEPVFQFTVEWNPNYPTPKKSQLTILVTNGTIDGKKTKTVTMFPTQSLPAINL